MTPNILEGALRTFGIEEPQITEIPGRAHQTWRVESPKGIYFLKKYAGHDLESLGGTIALIATLMQQGIPIPPILPNTDGVSITNYKGNLYVISPYIEHALLFAPEVSNAILTESAQELAMLHRVDQIIYKDILKTINFASTTKAVTDLIVQFKNQTASLIGKHPASSGKLQLLGKIIDATTTLRQSQGTPQFASPWVCIHGDYTPDNMLIEQTSGKLFIIDWDNTKIAPRAFEIHKAIGAFCGLAPLNAYLVPIDWKKTEVFLRAYYAVNPLTEEVVNEIVTSAAYGSSVYWLRFTLLQTLAGDFRMLDLLPAKIEDCLFWKNNLNKYRRLLMTIVK